MDTAHIKELIERFESAKFDADAAQINQNTLRHWYAVGRMNEAASEIVAAIKASGWLTVKG